MKLDRTDRRILQAMQGNARISNLELAEAVGLSPTPCSRRVKRLEESGMIRAHVTLLDQSKLGLKLTAYIGISMDRHTPDRFEAFEAEVLRLPGGHGVFRGHGAILRLPAQGRGARHGVLREIPAGQAHPHRRASPACTPALSCAGWCNAPNCLSITSTTRPSCSISYRRGLFDSLEKPASCALRFPLVLLCRRCWASIAAPCPANT